MHSDLGPFATASSLTEVRKLTGFFETMTADNNIYLG